MTIGKRYKFNGSRIAVETARATAKPITAITKANPAVLSVSTHGYSIGDTVYVNAEAGMPELTAGEYVVGSSGFAAGTFSLVGVNSTNFTTFATESPNANVVQKVTFSDFCELTGYNQQDGQADQMEATTVCSTAKEFEVGLRDTGTVSLDYNAAPLSTVQTAIRAAQRAGTSIAIVAVFPGTGGTLIAFGSVLSTTVQGGNGDFWKATASLKLSGDIVVLNAAGVSV